MKHENMRQLAYDNAYNFQSLKDDLVRLRIASKLEPEDVAALLGCNVTDIDRIEQQGSNPTLAALEVYALAIGAKVEIKVTQYV